MEIMKQEQKKWEKAFEKKMTNQERVMFNWGLVYGMERAVKEQKNHNHGRRI